MVRCNINNGLHILYGFPHINAIPVAGHINNRHSLINCYMLIGQYCLIWVKAAMFA
jgi:hypothetical protein